MTFSEKFARSQGQPIHLDGREVMPMLRRAVVPGCRIRVIWRSARALPVQGIRMKVRRGKLSMGEADLDDIVLWRDTTPNETVFVCRAQRTAELRIWNCWRDDRGVMQAWVGNAAMRVVESGQNDVRVECNSRPEVTFEDLLFDVIFEVP